jgi:hypothetical protein
MDSEPSISCNCNAKHRTETKFVAFFVSTTVGYPPWVDAVEKVCFLLRSPLDLSARVEVAAPLTSCQS